MAAHFASARIFHVDTLIGASIRLAIGPKNRSGGFFEAKVFRQFLLRNRRIDG